MDYLQSTIGFFALLSLGAIFSENIKSINLKYVVSVVVIQLFLTILLNRLFRPVEVSEALFQDHLH